jgi:hypothetical protein
MLLNFSEYDTNIAANSTLKIEHFSRKIDQFHFAAYFSPSPTPTQRKNILIMPRALFHTYLYSPSRPPSSLIRPTT